MLFLVSLLMLYIKRHIRDNDVDDDQDVYLIAREMHHRELALQKKNNVNSIPSIKDRPLLDQIPEHEIWKIYINKIAFIVISALQDKNTAINKSKLNSTSES